MRSARSVTGRAALAALVAVMPQALARDSRAAGLGHATLSLGGLVGSTRPAAGLADFQWDTGPKLGYGAQALVRFGRFDSGLRLWRTETTQDLDLGNGAGSPAVRSTSVELLGRAGLAEPGGVRVLALATAGRLHLGYHPDRVTLPTTGEEVLLSPVDTWVAGAGLGAERALRGAWSLGVTVEHRVFGLDTASRESGAVVNRRESFGEWSARLEIERIYGRR